MLVRENGKRMSATARITVTAGPDRGKEFELVEELTHMGRGEGNQIALEDPALGDHQASIARRSGRHAIYAAMESTVEIDGNIIPPKRWVWLPSTATIRLGPRTVLEFHCEPGADDSPADSQSADLPPSESQVLPAPAPRSSRGSKRAASKKAGRSKRAGAGRQVARFITDEPGDPLVRLGEDGHMPELTLAAGDGQKPKRESRQEKNPATIYVAAAVSFFLSMAMLLIDFEPGGTSVETQSAARRELAEFYGKDGKDLLPYQRLLREARLAHSRKDSAGERRAYRRVFALLNSEDNNPFTGLTGSPASDERLRELIAILNGG